MAKKEIRYSSSSAKSEKEFYEYNAEDIRESDFDKNKSMDIEFKPFRLKRK